MKATNIEGDVDNDEERAFLPKEVVIPEGMVDKEEISDYLSDFTGFCHKCFQLIESEKDSQAIACNGIPIFDGHGGIMTTDDAICLENVWEKSENYMCNHSSILNNSSKDSLDQQIKSASTRAAESQPTSKVKVKEPEPEI